MSTPFATESSSPAPAVPELHPRPVLLGLIELRMPTNGDSQVHVHASVALGDLLPGDVDVDLHFDCGAEPSLPSAVPPHRMWSESAGIDGWFRFAALITISELDAATRLHVHVRAKRDPVSLECLASGSLLLRRI